MDHAIALPARLAKWTHVAMCAIFAAAILALAANSACAEKALAAQRGSDPALSAPISAQASAKTPAKPTLRSAALAAGNSATVKWAKAKRAKKYQVLSSKNGGAYKVVATTKSLSFTHKNLALGATYSYKVKAVNGRKKSAASSAKTVRTLSSARPKLTAVARNESITVSWKKVGNASGYKVYLQADSGYQLKGTTSSLSFKVGSLDLGTVYSFKVVPFIKSGSKQFEGTSSTVAKATPSSAYLMDLMKPYQTKGAWEDCTTATFTMAGDTYTHGFYARGAGAASSELYFNLKGAYSKMTFTAGFVSSWYDARDGGVSIYADDELLQTISIGHSDLPKSYTLDIAGCSKLHLVFTSDAFLLDASEMYGLADIKVYA